MKKFIDKNLWEVSTIEIFAIVVATIFFLVGLVGTMVPVMPGPPTIWLGMLVYGLIAGFDDFSVFFFIAQALLALAVMGIDYLFSAMGTRFFGGTKAGFWGAALGLLIGLFFFPFGLLIGPFLGAVLAELIYRGQTDQAIRSGFGASLGFFGALPFKLLLEAVMIFWFITNIV